MSDEKYEARMKGVIADSPDVALELHMEMKRERDSARAMLTVQENKLRMANRNIRFAIKCANDLIDLCVVMEAYEYIMNDLAEHDKEKYQEYWNYIKDLEVE